MTKFSNIQERQAEGQYLCTSMKVNIMSFLLNQFGSVEFTEQEIDRCIGILKVNGMKLENGGLKQTPGVILYPIYCLINSACISNRTTDGVYVWDDIFIKCIEFLGQMR